MSVRSYSIYAVSSLVLMSGVIAITDTAQLLHISRQVADVMQLSHSYVAHRPSSLPVVASVSINDKTQPRSHSTLTEMQSIVEQLDLAWQTTAVESIKIEQITPATQALALAPVLPKIPATPVKKPNQAIVPSTTVPYGKIYPYAHWVEASAREFDVDANLLYAVIETESQFNPRAVSHAGAMGLMQIVPNTAGRDVLAWLYGQKRTPSRQELFDPQNNIRLGAAYMAMLSEHYFKDIHHPKSKEYVVLAAYNGGLQRVIQIFGQDQQQAARIINALTPSLVYDVIRRHHVSGETRDYLQKVQQAQHRYQQRI